MQKLIISYTVGSTAVSIGLVDEKGNGVTILRGTVGGYDFLNEAEYSARVKVLHEAITAWNDAHVFPEAEPKAECPKCKVALVGDPNHSIGGLHAVCPKCHFCPDCDEGAV